MSKSRKFIKDKDGIFKEVPLEIKTVKKKKPMKPPKTLIFEALGEVSMCWSEIPKGIFDSTKAKEIGDKLIKDLTSLSPTVTEWVSKKELSDEALRGYADWYAKIESADDGEQYIRHTSDDFFNGAKHILDILKSNPPKI